MQTNQLADWIEDYADAYEDSTDEEGSDFYPDEAFFSNAERRQMGVGG